MATPVINSTETNFAKELSEFREFLGINNPGAFETAIREDAVKLMDTEPILTLKKRYQLGLLYKIDNDEWRNATHSRYDHTVGVVAKCIIACDIVNSNTEDPKIKLTEKDVRELVVAAMLHDCGHLPLSHATERAFRTTKDIKKGISHEERIIPLIVNHNPYFEKFREIVLSWKDFDETSFYRIACIISPEFCDDYIKKSSSSFVAPKRAIQQLLVSEIDMDRLDYITRDADKLNYTPVTLIKQRIIEYIKGLSLERYKSLYQNASTFTKSEEVDVELCVNESRIESVFYLLVSRVLLYKYIYFSERLRSFEAVLTYLVGTLIEQEVAMEPLKLIAMSDQDFIDSHLEKLISYIEDKDDFPNHLIKKYVNVLRYDKVERFKSLLKIHEYDLGNPRLKEEFIKNINKRSYIDNLRNHLLTHAPEEVKMERGDILLDVFHLQTGGGELLVKSKKKGEYSTLSSYMNGSNIHRLCSEIRLDIYIKSDSSDKKKKYIRNEINNFFKNI